MSKIIDQFLSDVVTAAGLLSCGKKCKALATRIGEGAFSLRLRGLAAQMNADEVRELLQAKLEGRTHDALAADLGVTQGYLSKVLAGDCNPGEKLLRQMGLRKVVCYEPDNVGAKLETTAAPK